MTPEVHVEVEPTRILPRLGHGVCWSQVVAEIAEDAGGSETGGKRPEPLDTRRPRGRSSMKHHVQSVVVNRIHLQECRRCGRRWLPSQQTPTQGPDVSTCPGPRP